MIYAEDIEIRKAKHIFERRFRASEEALFVCRKLNYKDAVDNIPIWGILLSLQDTPEGYAEGEKSWQIRLIL